MFNPLRPGLKQQYVRLPRADGFRGWIEHQCSNLSNPTCWCLTIWEWDSTIISLTEHSLKRTCSLWMSSSFSAPRTATLQRSWRFLTLRLLLTSWVLRETHWKSPHRSFTFNYETAVMKLSRKFCSCQVAWHVSTCDGCPTREPAAWGCFVLQLASCVITALTKWTNICQDFSWFSPCDQVCFLLSVCVSKRLCALLKKPQCCIIYQPGERRCSHLISHPPCVLIVSANSGLFKQVRCKCSWSDLHFPEQK